MPWMYVRRRRRSYGGYRRSRGYGYRRSTFRRRSYGRPMRRSGYRRPYYSFRGRGRYRGRGRRGPREVRLVIQTPSDMLPPRPTAGGWARLRRRARF